MPKLTEHFSLEEMIFSETAARHGIDNRPDAVSRKNLMELCENMLEPIRELVGGPINVTSGYRCAVLNSVIGDASNSQHMMGEAADINCPLLNPRTLFQRLRQSELAFDQLIDEFGSWVHVSLKRRGNRGEVLRARKNNGVTHYEKL
jgi:zinc D-Ala-D-Ala carboxypeptidase